jgi:hypothetical protein
MKTKVPDGVQAEILFTWCKTNHAQIKVEAGKECPICEPLRRVAEFNSKPRKELDENIDDLRAECFYAMRGEKSC